MGKEIPVVLFSSWSVVELFVILLISCSTLRKLNITDDALWIRELKERTHCVPISRHILKDKALTVYLKNGKYMYIYIV